MRQLAAIVAVFAVGACRDAFDPDKPIDVVAIGSWSDAQRADLDHAAECWNLGFGVDYQTGSTSDGQRVEVEFNDVECLYSAWALTTDGFTSQVSLCPEHFPSASDGSLFGVLTHELGHVAGIPADVDHDPDAIMGGVEPIAIANVRGRPIFDATDRGLFASYNPDFKVKPTCPPTIQQIDGEFLCNCDGGFASAAAAAIGFDSQGNLYVAGDVGGIVRFAGDELVPIGTDDVLLASYAPDGSYRWAQRFGAASQSAHATAIAIDSADNVYIAGIASSAIDFGGAAGGLGGNTFTASFAATGAYHWSRADPSNSYATPSLAVAGDAVYFQTEVFGKAMYSPTITVDAGEGTAAVTLAADSATGGLRWGRSYSSNDSTPCGIVATASSVTFAVCDGTAQGWSTRLVSVTTTGAARWNGVGPASRALGLAGDIAGNLYTAGWTDGGALTDGDSISMVVASYDPQGAARWSASVPGATSVVGAPPVHVAVDASGRVAVDGRIGTDASVMSIADDELVATLTSDGAPVSSQVIVGTGVATTSAIAFDASGALSVAGGYGAQSTIGAVDFGAAPVIENGGLFVLRVTP